MDVNDFPAGLRGPQHHRFGARDCHAFTILLHMEIAPARDPGEFPANPGPAPPLSTIMTAGSSSDPALSRLPADSAAKNRSTVAAAAFAVSGTSISGA